MCSIYSPLPKPLNLSEHGLKKGGLLFLCIHQMTKFHLDAFCSCSQSLHWILPLSLGLLTYFLSFYLLCERYISCTDSVVALAESFLRSQIVSVLLCIDNIGRCSLMTIAGAPGSIPYWCSPTSLSGPAQYVWICLSLCTLGVWPLMDFLLQGMVLPWSLGDTCVSADDGGGVDSTQMSRGGGAEWRKWCTLEASPGHLVVCHASLLPPAPLLLGPFPLCAGDSWQIGKALLLILWYLGTQERSYPCTARVWGAGILWRGGSSCVSPVLCVWPVKV